MNYQVTNPKDLSLTPWDVHRELLRQTPPALRYDAAEPVTDWQRRLRRKLRELLKLTSMPDATAPPTARVLWQRNIELGSITKVALDMEPAGDAVGYLCLPSAGSPPYPTVICLQGHTTGMHLSIGLDSLEQQPIPVEGDRDFALQCMGRGLVAFCLEQRSFSQRSEREVGKDNLFATCQQSQMNALMLGRTLTGERVYDIGRVIDWLTTRDDVDHRWIGCMGNSGGGTATLYAAAVDQRIGFAIASCSFCTFEDSIMRIHHCVDNYVPGIRLVAEMGDVAGLIAPRPLIVVNGQKDEIFPIEPAKREFEHVRKIYRNAGSPECCEMVIGPEGHDFYADLAWPRVFALTQWAGRHEQR
jgi:dienelactone hydrolase